MAVTVQFGDADATGVTVVSDTELTATSPAGTGVVDVTVTTSGGSDSLNDGYTYAPPPAITAVDPLIVVASNPTTVTLTGTGLDAVADSTAVGLVEEDTGAAVGQLAPMSGATFTDTSITFTVANPAVPSAQAGIPLQWKLVPSGLLSPPVMATYPPALISIDPTDAVAGVETEFELTGQNLQDVGYQARLSTDETVTVDLTIVDMPDWEQGVNQIATLSGTLTAGVWDVITVDEHGDPLNVGTPHELADAITVTDEAAFPVTLTSADPTEVPVSPGGSFVVTITGTGLSDVGGSILPAGMPYRLAYITPTSNTFDTGVVTQVSDTEMSTQPGSLGAVGDYYWVVRDATTQAEVSNRLAFTVIA